MKDSVDRTVGVIDADGIVVACSELTCIGEHWSGAVTAVNAADHAAAHFEGKTFKPLAGWGAQFDYAAFVQGEDEMAGSLCAMAVVAFNGAKAFIPRPRSCTSSPRPPGPPSWCASWAPPT